MRETLLLIPRHSDQFLGSLNARQWTEILRGCLLVFVLSHRKAVPRDFHFKACLGPLGGCDTVLSSGNGTGKTLVLILLTDIVPRRHFSPYSPTLNGSNWFRYPTLQWLSMFSHNSCDNTSARRIQVVWYIISHN